MAAYDDEMKAAAVGSRYENEIKGVSGAFSGAKGLGLVRLGHCLRGRPFSSKALVAASACCTPAHAFVNLLLLARPHILPVGRFRHNMYFPLAAALRHAYQGTGLRHLRQRCELGVIWTQLNVFDLPSP